MHIHEHVAQIPADQLTLALDLIIDRLRNLAPRPNPELALVVDRTNGTVTLYSDRADLDVQTLRADEPDPERTGPAEARLIEERLHVVAKVDD